MKLTFEHLKAYPFGNDGIKVIADNDGIERYINGIYTNGNVNLIPSRGAEEWFEIHRLKLKLRHLSGLTKEIVHKGQKGGDVFIPARILMCPQFKFCDDREDLLFDLQSPESIQRCPYNVVQKLLEWHFDIFELLEQGLAIKK